MLSCMEADIVGKVVSVKKGKVIVELDEGSGVEVGTHLAVIPPSSLEEHPELGQALVCKHNGGVTAVVEIGSVSQNQVSGEIGRGSAATAGDLVFVTDWEPTYWKWWPVFPEAYGNIWEFMLRLHVMPDFWERGVSFDGQMSLSYQFSMPLRFQLMMLQLIVAYEDRYLVSALPAFFMSYSSRFFELGFGVGMHHNSIERINGVSLFQMVRFGAENGLMARVYTVFKYNKDEWWEGGPSGLQFDSVFWEVKAPIHSRVAFFLESWSGGLASGGFRVTGGLQLMFNGTGGPGTIVVPIGVGGGEIDWVDPDCDWRTDDDACWEEDFYLVSFILTTGISMKW